MEAAHRVADASLENQRLPVSPSTVQQLIAEMVDVLGSDATVSLFHSDGIIKVNSFLRPYGQRLKQAMASSSPISPTGSAGLMRELLIRAPWRWLARDTGCTPEGTTPLW